MQAIFSTMVVISSDIEVFREHGRLFGEYFLLEMAEAAITSSGATCDSYFRGLAEKFYQEFSNDKIENMNKSVNVENQNNLKNLEAYFSAILSICNLSIDDIKTNLHVSNELAEDVHHKLIPLVNYHILLLNQVKSKIAEGKINLEKNEFLADKYGRAFVFHTI